MTFKLPAIKPIVSNCLTVQKTTNFGKRFLFNFFNKMDLRLKGTGQRKG